MMMTWPNARAGPGFELAVARDLFVHHFGSRTFVGNGVDAEKLLNENQERFTDQVGLATGQRHTCRAEGFHESAAEEI